MMNILYISRHMFTKEQMAAVVENHGPVNLTQASMTVNTPKEVARMMKEGKYDELIVVLPLGIIQGLCAYGLEPILVRGNMEDGVWHHDHFEKITEVQVMSTWW